ncbi:MAG: RdgB/HAM1 family non-canonical purine NTP pyrophosphatase [Acidobacteria bacterium]|nr:RdgB/HAM1 family non-canonical purine NTP pyrophosphatase [Acidobacteriota bacterium]
MSPERTLLIATLNPGKVQELSEMLAAMDAEVVGLDSFPAIVEVEETGRTFAENARLKAAGYARQTGLPALADDSGLEVRALGGRPGVLSARYGGDVPFSEKIRLLLAEIAESGSQDRSARFVCSIALANADGSIVEISNGICDGRIVDHPRGTCGFGYDPVFMPDGCNETFGELSSAVKGKISHRSRAFSQIMPILGRFFGI